MGVNISNLELQDLAAQCFEVKLVDLDKCALEVLHRLVVFLVVFQRDCSFLYCLFNQ